MERSIYVLLQCDLGHEEEIISLISGMPEIVEVRGTYGMFDIFCRVRADPDRTERIITAIRRIPHIRSSTTLKPIISQGGR